MTLDLSGAWQGRYDYDAGGNPVPFEAELVDQAGALSGQIIEPNTIPNAKGAQLKALVEGAHDGAVVRFVKFYTGFDHGDDPVYEGQLDAAGGRMSGRWTFPLDPQCCGRFVMVRAVKARVLREVSDEVSVG